MDGEIDFTRSKRFFDLLGEHALGADLRESNVGDPVARGLDDLYLHLVAARAQLRRDVIGLPKCELRAARADAHAGHVTQWPSPTFFSLRLKTRRMSSIMVVASASFAADFSVVMGACSTLFTI